MTPRKPRTLLETHMRQRDLDLAVVRAAPAVCDEILDRLRAGVPELFDVSTTRGFTRGHRVAWDRAIALVEKFKQDVS